MSRSTRHHLSRHSFTALAALALVAGAVPAAFADGPVQDPIPVGPDTYFVGLVNGVPSATPTATITVVCPGPISLSSTGHPIAGQTVEVETVVPVTSAVPGYTGSAADSIDVIFSTPSAAAANPPIVLTSFFVKYAIPTTDVFPCEGTGTVSFVPIPTSATARGYSVPVTFLNIGV